MPTAAANGRNLSTTSPIVIDWVEKEIRDMMTDEDEQDGNEDNDTETEIILDDD